MPNMEHWKVLQHAIDEQDIGYWDREDGPVVRKGAALMFSRKVSYAGRMVALCVAIACVTVGGATAGVSIKNGNFYITYTDVNISDGEEPLAITRTYNSKSTRVGVFGFGWGSAFETFLSVVGDGSIVVHENGGGARTLFLPASSAERASDEGSVGHLIAATDALSLYATPAQRGALAQRMLDDAELRASYYRRYRPRLDEEKLLETVPIGAAFVSNIRGLQTVIRDPGGFVRRYNDGKTERFNLDGRLISIAHTDGYTVQVSYDDSHNLRAIRDSSGKSISFQFDSAGLVRKITLHDTSEFEG